MIKKFNEYFEHVGFDDDKYQDFINRAEELTGLQLDDNNIIPELRNYIELKLEEGDDELADTLTSLKKEIEEYEN